MSINAEINPSARIVAKHVTLHNVSKTDVGLENVDNTSDINKPISNATQTALDLKANQSTTYTKTEVDANIENLVAGAPGQLDTLNELAAALGDNTNFASTTTTSIGQKLAKASNLSDLANATIARINLGLGTAATTASSDYATAAQGTSADNALVASAVSTFGGTLIDDADAATARTTLGLGTAATTASSDYAPAAGSSSITTVGTLTDLTVDGNIRSLTPYGYGTYGELKTANGDKVILGIGNVNSGDNFVVLSSENGYTSSSETDLTAGNGVLSLRGGAGVTVSDNLTASENLTVEENLTVDGNLTVGSASGDREAFVVNSANGVGFVGINCEFGSPTVPLEVVGDVKIIGSSSPVIHLQKPYDESADNEGLLFNEQTRLTLGADDTKNPFEIQTYSTGVFVSNDYRIEKDTAGASKHEFRIGNNNRVVIEDDGIDVTGNATISGTLTTQSIAGTTISGTLTTQSIAGATSTGSVAPIVIEGGTCTSTGALGGGNLVFEGGESPNNTAYHGSIVIGPFHTGGINIGQSAVTTTQVFGEFRVDSDTSANPFTLKVDTANDRVGINVESPTEALDVSGNAIISGDLTVNGKAIDTSDKEFVFEVHDESNMSGNKWYKIADVNNGNGGLHIRGFIANHVESFASQKLDIAINGRESNAGGNIEIIGTVDVLHNDETGTDKAGIRIIKAEDGTDNYDRYDVYVRTCRYNHLRLQLIKSGNTSIFTSPSHVTSEPQPIATDPITEIDTSSFLPGTHTITDSQVRQVIKEDGNVGIGTNTPSEKLHIGGTARTDQLLLGDEWDTNSPSGGDKIYIKDSDSASNYDPLGTLSDGNNNTTSNKNEFPLLISNDSSATGNPTSHGILLYNANGGAGTFAPSILFGSRESDAQSGQFRAATGGIYCRTPIGVGGAASGTYGDGELIFATSGLLNGSTTSNSEGLSQRMVIDRSGRVGINNSAPSEVLDVTGNIKASGTITPGIYADTNARDTAIPSPTAGMMVFITSGTKFQGYTGSAWVDFN